MPRRAKFYAGIMPPLGDIPARVCFRSSGTGQVFRSLTISEGRWRGFSEAISVDALALREIKKADFLELLAMKGDRTEQLETKGHVLSRGAQCENWVLAREVPYSIMHKLRAWPFGALALDPSLGRTRVDIKPTYTPHTRRQETITGLTEGQISIILGFDPIEEDPDLVQFVWDFDADGIPCSVWSYKGSHKFSIWSAFGPRAMLVAVFGADHIRE